MDIDNTGPKRRRTNSNNNNDRPRKKIKDNDEDIIRYMLDDHSDSDDNDDNNYDNNNCPNPLCDHKPLLKGEVQKPVDMVKEINTIEDLITLGKTYHCRRNTLYYGLDLKVLCNLVEPLTKLSKMVGMKNVKENMVNQIVFFLQGFDKKDKCGECMNCINKRPCTVKDENLKHVVIYGGPGIGKTELGKILAGVYKGMGLLSKGNFVVANRSDLVGEYLGHTAAKTDRFF